MLLLQTLGSEEEGKDAVAEQDELDSRKWLGDGGRGQKEMGLDGSLCRIKVGVVP